MSIHHCIHIGFHGTYIQWYLVRWHICHTKSHWIVMNAMFATCIGYIIILSIACNTNTFVVHYVYQRTQNAFSLIIFFLSNFSGGQAISSRIVKQIEKASMHIDKTILRYNSNEFKTEYQLPRRVARKDALDFDHDMYYVQEEVCRWSYHFWTKFMLTEFSDEETLKWNVNYTVCIKSSVCK